MRVERGEATTQDYVEEQYLGGVGGGGGGGQTSRIMFKLTNIYIAFVSEHSKDVEEAHIGRPERLVLRLK